MAHGAPRTDSWVRAFAGSAIAFIAGVVTIPALPILAWAMRRWTQRHRYWLTNRRLVVQEGIVGQEVRSVPLDRIVDVAVTQNWLDRLFGVVNINVRDMTGESSGAEGGMSKGLRLFDVQSPQSWKRLILARTGKAPQDAASQDRVVALLEALVANTA